MKKLFLFAALLMFSMASLADINDVAVLGYIARNWSAIDSSYIEPTLYDFSVQAVEQNNQEELTMETDDGMKVRVQSPFEAKVGVGAFWTWLGANYTFSVKHGTLMDGTKKTMFGLSIFSQLFNINLKYRCTGGDFTLKTMETPSLGDLIDFDKTVQELTGQSIGIDNMAMGKDCSIKMISVDINYIWNHKKFSYPAAQSNSGRQLRSAGSLITGLAYTHYDIDNNFADFQVNSALFVDYAKKYVDNPNVRVYDVIRDAITGNDTKKLFGGELCSSLHFKDLSLNIGYGYNWVPYKNFLISGSVTLSPSLKICSGDNFNSSAMQMFKDASGETLTSWLKDMCYDEELAEPGYQTALSDMKSNLQNAYDKTAYSFHKTIFDLNGSVRLAAIWSNARWYAGAQFVYQHYRYHTKLYTKFDNSFFDLNFTVGLRIGRSKDFRKGGKYYGRYPDPKIL